MASPPRAVFLTNVVSPLHVPLLARISARGNVDLRVLYLNENEETRRWKEDPATMTFPYEILSRKVRPRQGLPGLRFDRLARRALAHRPDVLIAGGWSSPEILGTLAVTAPLRVPAVMVSASTLATRRRERPGLARLKRLVMARFRAGIVPGPMHVEYLLAHGMARSTIFEAPYCVPGDDYRAAAASPEPLAGDPVLLFVGRLTDEKGLHLLIDALGRIEATPTLHIVGEGAEQPRLEALAQASPAADRIVFHGYKPRGEVGGFLASADLFVLPSVTEAWGLVLNEAMEVGTPVLASDTVGAAPVLALPGRTGGVFRSGDPADLARVLESLLADRAALERLGEGAREVVAECNFDRAAAGWEAAVQAAMR